jgi:hypothetical protein
MQKSNEARQARAVRVFVRFGALAAGALLISRGGATWAGAAGCAIGGNAPVATPVKRRYLAKGLRRFGARVVA